MPARETARNDEAKRVTQLRLDKDVQYRNDPVAQQDGLIKDLKEANNKILGYTITLKELDKEEPGEKVNNIIRDRNLEEAVGSLCD